jgi:chemotaxis protein MotB
VGRFGLAIALSLAACVSQQQHDAVLRDLADAKAELTACQGELGACKDDRTKLETQMGSELSATKEELEELRRQRAEVEQQFADLTSKLQALIDAGDLEVYMRRGLIMIGLQSQVLFPSGKAELSERGQKALGKVAAVLAEIPERRLQVAGHTDNEPIGGKLEWKDNWELSTARALVVTRFLVGKGVKPENLAAAGHGEFDPVAANKNAAGRRKNRRIELILVPDLSALGRAAGAKPTR